MNIDLTKYLKNKDVKINNDDFDFDAMKKDKKNATDKVRFVLQEDIGETVITEVDGKEVLAVLGEK